MDIRTAVFASMASAGLVVAGWAGSPAPLERHASTPPVPLVAPGTALPGPRAGTTAAAAPSDAPSALPGAGAGPDEAGGLSPADPSELLSGAPVQLAGGAGYAPSAYPGSLQSLLDAAHA